MNRADLRAQFRSEADDQSTPPLFADTEVHDWLNQAVEEAAVRADLLLEVDNATYCELAITAGTAAYDLDAAVTRVAYARYLPTGGAAEDAVELELINRTELDRRLPTWRTDSDTPRFLLVENGKARLAPNPTEDGTVTMDVYRLPASSMTDDAHSPEIRAVHHRHLVDWALFRAYSKPDSETQDLARAAAAEARFERRFGLRPDADMKQSAEVVPQFNKAWI